MLRIVIIPYIDFTVLRQKYDTLPRKISRSAKKFRYDLKVRRTSLYAKNSHHVVHRFYSAASKFLDILPFTGSVKFLEVPRNLKII